MRLQTWKVSRFVRKGTRIRQQIAHGICISALKTTGTLIATKGMFQLNRKVHEGNMGDKKVA
ncbi:MAG: hypothetical protein DMF62_16650, partial [Acidobacteria bacterium]